MRALRTSLATMVVAGIAVLGGIGSAQADFLAQTFADVSQAVPYPSTFGAARFDPTLGTLNSVQIAVTSNITGEADIFHFNPTTQTFTAATASIPVTLSGPASLALAVRATVAPTSGTVAPDGGGVTGHTTVAGITDTAKAGTGTYSGTANPGVASGGAAFADAKVVITYNFSSVPEPATYALLGLGSVVGLLGRRALRRRAA